MGATYGRDYIIRKYVKDPEDVILLLGMDDTLSLVALHTIDDEYEKGMWMTYGNWRNEIGKMNQMTPYFDDVTHATRDYRKVTYRSTNPNTFKKFLYDQIPQKDHKIDGKWIDVCTEGEVMFSCLEMCGKDRIGVINEPIYMYRQGIFDPNIKGWCATLSRFGKEYKKKVYDIICDRPKRDLYETNLKQRQRINSNS